MFDNENIEETHNGGGQNVNEGDFEENGNLTPHPNSNRDELEDERAESVSETSSRNRSPTPDVTIAEKHEFLRDMAEKLQSAVYSMENLKGNSKDILYRMESVAKQFHKSMGRLTEITGTIKQALDLSTKTNHELLKFLLQNGGGTPSGTG
ncbi:uncharacterized protein LOC116165009 [Photinus pyralis]|uniref:uncharacterized protein LOC116165009 n=1 Tax=Photinus pyralis TaxID=7054 RepID=UPI001267638C|nr:uncharacterized protein LOC116165009 [Photinus pyralis]